MKNPLVGSGVMKSAIALLAMGVNVVQKFVLPLEETAWQKLTTMFASF